MTAPCSAKVAAAEAKSSSDQKKSEEVEQLEKQVANYKSVLAETVSYTW